MRRYISCFIWTMFLPLTVHAGSMGSMPASFSGLLIGAGGSYVSTNLTGETTVQTQPPISAPGTFIISSANETHFAPVGQVGYFYDVTNDWLLGARVLYKYIGIEQFDISWSGTLQNGAYQTGGIHSKLQDEWLFLVDVGYHFDHWLIYGGLGASLFRVSAQLNGDVLPAGSFNFFSVNEQNNKNLWGGAGHVGMAYSFPHGFTIDISYDYAISQAQNLPSLNFPSGNSNYYSNFIQNLQAGEQGINITINKYFNI